ncbi:MAG: hypothetical protein IPI49_03725 [Myxococcales bacterium]|nr:hypothetical protein [Myxococcales bacterium]
MRAILVLLALGAGAVCAGCAACASVEVPVAVPPVSKGTVRIRSFTEPSAARAVRAVGPFVFVVNTDGIERWDRDGNMLELSATHGLPSSEILRIASDSEREVLWILTPGALGRYHTDTEVYDELPAPPGDLAPKLQELRATDRIALAPAADGGVWLGTPAGLFLASDDGYTEILPDPVAALAVSSAGLVIATDSGLKLRAASGEVTPLRGDQGCAVTQVSLLLAAPRLGGDLVVGRDAQGGSRLAIGGGEVWHCFRVLPGVDFDTAALDDDGVLLMGGGLLYRLALRDHQEVRPLARDGARLSAMSGGGPDLSLAATQLALPPGAISLEVSGDHVLVGTRETGVARFGSGELRPGSWLRRGRMFVDASTLTVACAAPDNCWIATGSRSAWHWTGDRFTPGGPDEVVLAVVRDRAGFILALHRETREAQIRLSRVDSAGQWAPIPKVLITTPGKDPEVSFARYSSSGALWVGLRYREGAELRAFGVAIIDVPSGRVQLHHTRTDAELEEEARSLRPGRRAPRERDPRQVAAKMMPIPRGVVDGEIRGDAAWFATSEGVARLAAGEVKLWDENNGLRSELTRAVAVTRGNTVYVATRAGVGRFDGARWLFPPQLGFEVNDLAVTNGGQLWMATSRGIAAYDGSKVRRVDLRRGLVENQILDIAVDRYDRIWGRGPGSLTLISPTTP